MKTSVTLTLDEIKKHIGEGYKVSAYGGKDDYIAEISFSKKTSSGLVGFSFDVGCGLRQRELKSLFNRIKKVKPNLKITNF